jgi:hypothetical protein
LNTDVVAIKDKRVGIYPDRNKNGVRGQGSKKKDATAKPYPMGV